MKWSRENFVRMLLIWVNLFQNEECQIISRVQIMLPENRETSLR